MPGTDRTLDWIVLSDLNFDAIVGILPSEQIAAQPLELEIKMGLDVEECADTGDLSKSVNYASIAEQARFIAQHGRWRLIESLATALCRMVLVAPAVQEERAQVDRVEVRIRKPTIIAPLAVPGITVRRRREWCEPALVKQAPRTTLEALESTALSAAYRVEVAPGTAWKPPSGVAILVVAGRPRVEGRALDVGEQLGRCAPPIENHQSRPITLLAVGNPL